MVVGARDVDENVEVVVELDDVVGGRDVEVDVEVLVDVEVEVVEELDDVGRDVDVVVDVELVVDDVVVGRDVEVEVDVELVVEVVVVVVEELVDVEVVVVDVELVVDVEPLGGRPRPRFAWISASPALRPVDAVTRNVIVLAVRSPIATEVGAPSRASGPVGIGSPPSSRSRRPFVTLSFGFGRS